MAALLPSLPQNAAAQRPRCAPHAVRALAHHRHPPLVRSRSYGPRPRRPPRHHHPVDVQQVPPAAQRTAAAKAAIWSWSSAPRARSFPCSARPSSISPWASSRCSSLPWPNRRPLKAAVVKEVRATYSVRPLLDTSPPLRREPLAGHLSRRRLDRHRLARHHGRRRPQRLRWPPKPSPAPRGCPGVWLPRICHPTASCAFFVDKATHFQ